MSAQDKAPLLEQLQGAPRIAHARQTAAKLADLLLGPCSSDFAILNQNARVHALLSGIADHSVFLWRLCSADPARLSRLLQTPPEQSLQAILRTLVAQCDDAETEISIMRLLRKARQETALLIALTDLGDAWGVGDVTRALSLAADCFIGCAWRYALRFAHQAGALALPDVAHPEVGCGCVILALGKLGAQELNYSSDVDLMVFFDGTSAAIANRDTATADFVRLAKLLVKLLQERTADGYVLRVDLRLRPDPGSTAIAISLSAAFNYYETLGQNWERAALIKARPVAGELALGARFIAELAPFIWRKYFDYAAIADIHAMKRQIHAMRGHAAVTVAGHDIKLGRGGIREIEFFVQTQQLIFGGRRPALRGPRTLDMLQALYDDGWIGAVALVDLGKAYVFLRATEHRLQMLDDMQTQRLPVEPAALADFARFCGFASYRGFAKTLTGHLKRVEREYARLFEHAPGLDTEAGNLVFTGVIDDPDTLLTLRKMGFRQPDVAAETVRGWHFGRRAAVQSPRAREVLTELLPRLLEAFAQSGDPDAALANFDSALAKMPAAIELFSLLKSNATLCALFGDILGGAPRLARAVIQRPHVLDAAVDPAMADFVLLEPRIHASLAPLIETESFLDRARDCAQEEMFAIGVRLLSGRIDPDQAAHGFTNLAECMIREALAHVERGMALEYGKVRGASCIVLAMGKLGSREMTAASDLDLILLYDFDAEHPESDGARKLHAVTYFARLTQRFVSTLTVATRRGRLYEVDMRLRPSGGKGPLATQMRSFLAYQADEAETWEHMALTRARVIAGDTRLGASITLAMRDILARQRDRSQLRRDIVDMRALIASQKGDADESDLKLVAGGILDIEFVCQYLVLAFANALPQLAQPNEVDVLAIAASHHLIAAQEAETLVAARDLYTSTTQMQRLMLEPGSDPALAGEGVRRRMAASAHLPDYAHLVRELAQTRLQVRAIYDAVLVAKT